ncbi:MAG: ABC transporter permease [Gemmatimonadota bacterium]
MDTILMDIKYGIRMLIKNPGIAAISILAFTLGIGLTTTAFSIVYGAIWRGLPFDEPHELVHLERSNLAEDIESMEVSIHDFHDWREQQTAYEGMAAFYSRSSYLSGSEGRPERYRGTFISANAFDLLRERPILGRSFRAGEDSPDAEPVLILSHAVWRDRYGQDPNVVGRTARLNGQTMEIIGVMPEGFRFPLDDDLWTPLRMDALEIERGEGETLEVFARLKPQSSLEGARAELAAIAKRLEMEYPESNEGIGSVVKPYADEFIGSQARTLLFTMLGAVAGVLLIACFNVANLLLARAASRSKEVAIRTALGASRMRVVFQLLAEALAIALVGGVLGLALGWVGVDLFNRAIVDVNPPFWIDIKIDPVAVMFVIGLVFTSSLIAGIFPAWQASGADVNEVLKDESRGSSSLRLGLISKVLVVAEVAFSMALLIIAGLMIKSIRNSASVDYAFATESIFTARIGLPEAEYPDSLSQIQFYDELLPRLQGRYGAEQVALTWTFPGLGSAGTRLAIEGETYDRDQDYPLARFVPITPEYFSAFQVSIRQGRAFTVGDNADALPVAIVNESFAREHYESESPLGRRIRFGTSDSERPWRTVVGVAPDMYLDGPENEDPEGIYVPLPQRPSEFVGIAIRAAGDPLAITPEVRDLVASVDDNMPVYFIDSLGAWIYQSAWGVRVFGVVFGIFGLAALFLASVGLYGVMAFAVRQRTKEVGVRMALGAERADVLKMILRQGTVLLGIGFVLGLGMGAGLAKLMEFMFFDVEPFDLTNFVLIFVVLGATGFLATLIPARRATRVDPVIALRYD